jgi:hypothetical protein
MARPLLGQNQWLDKQLIVCEWILAWQNEQPVAKLLPVHTTDSAKLIGSLKGRIKIKGNIMSTGIKWDAES